MGRMGPSSLSLMVPTESELLAITIKFHIQFSPWNILLSTLALDAIKKTEPKGVKLNNANVILQSSDIEKYDDLDYFLLGFFYYDDDY